MKKQNLAQLRKRLHVLADVLEHTEDAGLSCEECWTLLPAYVEAELDGEPMPARFPAIWHHLTVCDACSALYADLLEVALLEEAGQLPVLAAIPTPDLSFLPSRVTALHERMQRMAKTIVERLIPASLAELPSLCESFFERVEALGGAFQMRSASELALAFGAEASPALPILAATYSATGAILEVVEGEPQRTPAQLAGLLGQVARREARRLGLNRAQANTFAAEYVRAAQEHLPLPLDSEDG